MRQHYFNIRRRCLDTQWHVSVPDAYGEIRPRCFKSALDCRGRAFGMSTGLFPAATPRRDMATPYPDANFHTRNIVAFARDVNAATNGELKITIHCNGSLFKHPDIKRSVRRGLVLIGDVLISLLANEDPIYANPIRSRSWRHPTRTRKNFGKPRAAGLRPALEKDGLKVLYAVPWTPQGLYTANPVDGVADLEGVKFRAYNPTTSRFAELTGMVATQVEVLELPVAFATGIVEAMITGAETGANSKAWDFVSHFYDVGAWLPKNMVVVNAKSFDRFRKPFGRRLWMSPPRPKPAVGT